MGFFMYNYSWWKTHNWRNNYSPYRWIKLFFSVTTGGTGPSKRDVTPDATISIADKELPGFGELMRTISLKYVPTAILSRQTGVIRGNSLIINLPGQPKAIRQTIDKIFLSIPYCIDLIDGPYIETRRTDSFRPKNARR